MAIEVGSAFVSIIPSLKGASSTIQRELGRSGITSAVEQNLTSGATRAGSRAGGLFSRAFGRSTRNLNLPGPSASLLRNVRTYGYAIAGVSSLTVGLGLKTESTMEQARIAFTTMLGSADKAKKFLAGLTTFAEKTPFDLPGVVTASQKLLAFGFSAKQTLPTLTALGDAAAGLSLGTEGLDRLTTAIGQIQAKGKVQSDELLQLTEAGVPALKILANQFGTTTGNIQALVTKGLIPADKAIPALLSGLEKGTNGLAGPTAKFGGLMAKQSKTLGGVVSNIRDTISQGLGRAVRPLAKVLERDLPKAIPALRRGFKAAGQDIGEFLHGLGVAKDRSKGVATGFEQIGSAIRGTFNAIRGTFSFIGSHAGVFKALAAAVLGGVVAFKAFKAVTAVGSFIAPVVVGIGRLVGAQWALNAAMDANPIGIIVTALGALVAGFIYAYKKSETFRNVVQGVFHVLERAAGLFVSLNVRGLKLIVDTWLTTAGVIVHAAASAFGWIPGLGGKLKGAVRAFDSFRSGVDSTLSNIANDAAGWGTAAGTAWGNGFIIASRKTQFADAAKFFVKGSGLGNLGKALGQNQGQTSAGAVGASIPQDVSSGIDSGASQVGKSMSALVDKILGPLKDLISKAKQLAQSVTQSILGDTGFGAIASQTDSFGSTFGTSVKSIISGFVSEKRDVLKFRRQLRLLDKRGLSDAAIKEIAGEGLQQGGTFATALAGATRKQLRKISRLRHGVHTGATGIGTDVAGNELGARIAREVRKTTHAVEKASKNTDLSPKTIHALEHAFERAEKKARRYVDLTEVDRRQGKKVKH